MDYQQLMFAIEVRKLALQMQQDELRQVQSEYAHVNVGALNEAVQNWYRDVPFTVFVKRAYSEIASVLDAIHEQQNQDSSDLLNKRLGL